MGREEVLELNVDTLQLVHLLFFQVENKAGSEERATKGVGIQKLFPYRRTESPGQVSAGRELRTGAQLTGAETRRTGTGARAPGLPRSQGR